MVYDKGMEKMKTILAIVSLAALLGGLGYFTRWHVLESIADKKAKEEQKAKRLLLELQRDIVLAPVRKEHQRKLEQAEKEALAEWNKKRMTPEEYEEYLRLNAALESVRLQIIEDVKKTITDERVLKKIDSMPLHPEE